MKINKSVLKLKQPTKKELQRSLRKHSARITQLKRELKIETALERVRVMSMAMYKSEQLAETARVLFEQFCLLGKMPDRMSIGIINEETGKVELWVTDQGGRDLNHEFFFSIDEPTSISHIYDAWKEGKDSITVDLTGERLDTWLRFVKEVAKLPINESMIHGRRVQQAAFFSQGFLLLTSHEPVADKIMKLLVRFAHVFDLTYTRFRDLLKAEAQTRNAILDKENIQSALAELKATQAQLIQSEKMASLGLLTAGIAHEIQNPLNFVNNFSDINKELVEELKIKNETLKIEDDEVHELLDAIAQNLEKINHHGKRADAIVKSMLQHSPTNPGKEELTDINALAQEYLNLSYHGVRAKDKQFNAVLKNDFDKNIGKIKMIRQDISRVLLNLYNNAFYAVSEKMKTTDESYEPTVIVQTKKLRSPSGNESIEIRVKDNGNGIPQKIVDKIFQPFFTTKPAGQGTGLGLSISFDIVKANGGELKVESQEGESTEFILQIPFSSNPAGAM